MMEQDSEVTTYEAVTESDGGIDVELRKKRVRRTVIGELKEAQEYIARLQGLLASADMKVESVGGFAQFMVLVVVLSMMSNIGLVIHILTHKGG